MGSNRRAEKKMESAQKAAWNINDWCAELGICRSMFYTLAEEPLSVKLGRRHLIVESPTDYANRIAEIQYREKTRV